jgi:hypothetical protein
VTEPTVWRERGLHYHAYSWRGDGKTMQDNETGRHDPATDLPPVLIREWLAKPQRLLRAAPLTPEDAARWLLAEYETVRPQLAGDIGEAITPAELARMKVYDLRCGNDVVIAHWLRGGGFVHLAVLSVPRAECNRHG